MLPESRGNPLPLPMNYRQLTTARSKRASAGKNRDPEPSREIDVEVLRPGEKPPPPNATSAESTTHDDPFIALVSRLMDSVFRVPGTNIRFGFDPIIGLVPGIGDAATAVTSLLLILQSARARVPRIVLARMVLNVLINTGVGAIPAVGDLFSVWFRSNVRNYELHRKHAGTRSSTTSDWLFILALLGGALLVIGFAIFSVIAWVQMLARWMR